MGVVHVRHVLMLMPHARGPMPVRMRFARRVIMLMAC